MTRRSSILDTVYEKDSSSNAFIIKVSIRSYKDIFNDLDPAPFRKRDLDPDLRTYLEDSSIDIPLKNKISLQFSASEQIKDREKEKKVILGLKTYFQFIIRTFQKEISHEYRKGGVYIICSFVLLLLAYYLSSIIPDHFLLITLVEGLFIGGWVFLWEAIAVVVFKNREIRLKLKRYRRLNKAPIRFIYE
ncbi:MAG: hypothetical protein ACMUIG_05165 [Thermoplasmatota archaeon]